MPIKVNKRFYVGIGAVAKTDKFANNNSNSSKASTESFANNKTKGVRQNSGIDYLLVVSGISKLDFKGLDFHDLQIPFLINKRVIGKLCKVNYNAEIETKEPYCLYRYDGVTETMSDPMSDSDSDRRRSQSLYKDSLDVCCFT